MRYELRVKTGFFPVTAFLLRGESVPPLAKRASLRSDPSTRKHLTFMRTFNVRACPHRPRMVLSGVLTGGRFDKFFVFLLMNLLVIVGGGEMQK